MHVLQAVLCEPRSQLVSLDVRGSRCDELVEDDAVVLTEAEISDTRHVLVQRQRLAGRGAFERSIDPLRGSMESDCEGPGKGPQCRGRNPDGDAPNRLDDVANEAVVLVPVDPDGDRSSRPHVPKQRPKA